MARAYRLRLWYLIPLFAFALWWMSLPPKGRVYRGTYVMPTPLEYPMGISMSPDGTYVAAVYQTGFGAFLDQYDLHHPNAKELAGHVWSRVRSSGDHFFSVWHVDSTRRIATTRREGSANTSCTYATSTGVVLVSELSKIYTFAGGSLTTESMTPGRAAVIRLYSDPETGIVVGCDEYGVLHAGVVSGVTAPTWIARVMYPHKAAHDAFFNPAVVKGGSLLAGYDTGDVVHLRLPGLTELGRWNVGRDMHSVAGWRDGGAIIGSRGKLVVLDTDTSTVRFATQKPSRMYFSLCANQERREFAAIYIDTDPFNGIARDMGVAVLNYPRCDELATTACQAREITYSWDGRRLAAAMKDGTIVVWDQ